MSRLSIRARLAAGFTAGLLIVFVAVGAFVYVRVDDQLLETLDAALRARFDEVARDAATTDKGLSIVSGLAEDDEAFSQVMTPSGKVRTSTLPPEADRAGILTPSQLARARTETVIFERPVAGLEEGETPIRILASRLPGPGGEVIVIVGATTDEHTEALAEVRNALVLGFPAALVISALIGYLLAGRALVPVERMRRRAADITLARSGERLPVGPADDEIRALGETLNEMLARIEASVERQRAFVSDASHELRTPLAVLKAELELAGDPGRDETELRAAISSAADEVDRLARLADDLLILARSDQGVLQVRPEQADVAEICGRVASRFFRRAEELGRDLVVDCALPGPVEIDVLRIEQALGNLIDNALRHGSGTVTVSSRLADDELLIEVSDEGPGIPSGFVPRAFERFTRADSGRTEGGTGLGLAIVQAIAAAHGGSAEADGSTIRIRLPSTALNTPEGLA